MNQNIWESCKKTGDCQGLHEPECKRREGDGRIEEIVFPGQDRQPGAEKSLNSGAHNGNCTLSRGSSSRGSKGRLYPASGYGLFCGKSERRCVFDSGTILYDPSRRPGSWTSGLLG